MRWLGVGGKPEVVQGDSRDNISADTQESHEGQEKGAAVETMPVKMKQQIEKENNNHEREGTVDIEDGA
jgi:hypothetical protein